MSYWYYAKDGDREGPVPEKRLRTLAESGDLSHDDLVWSTGMEDWQPVCEVDGILPEPPPLPEANPTGPSSRATSQPARSEEKAASAIQKTSESNRSTSRADAEKESENDSFAAARTNGRDEEKRWTYAGFGRRLSAFVVDLVLVNILAFAVGFVCVATGFFEGTSEEISRMAQATGFFVMWAYFANFESSSWQATPGKRTLGIKVTDLDGHQISFGQATGRHFGRILSAIPFLVGYLMAAFTKRKQALHDMLADCLVVGRRTRKHHPVAVFHDAEVSTMPSEKSNGRATPKLEEGKWRCRCHSINEKSDNLCLECGRSPQAVI